MEYAIHLIVFCAFSVAASYVLLRLQPELPLNPQQLPPLSPHLAMNTAIGFITGTAWTSYSGEVALSYFSQMVELVFLNFMSAATGICAAVALVRGLSRVEAQKIGNFWIDLTRVSLYVLLPLCLVLSVFFLSQGVIQNFSSYREIITLEGAKQWIAQGPAASQEAIKLLGSNGEGFFNASSAHPYENPNGFTNFMQMLAMLIIPSGIVFYFGRMIKDRRHAWSIWCAMAFLFLVGTALCAHFESHGNPMFVRAGCASAANWEGKEARFGVFGSALFASVTTASSTGAVNSMLDSFTPLGSLIPLVNMKLGEVVFGGVGSGLYGMIAFIILTVFIAGLMVGRTPEYLGKKVEGREIQLVMLATIVFPFVVLAFTAWASSSSMGRETLGNPGVHGFTEILYAYTSGGANNGSSLAGLSTNTPFWDLSLAAVMFLGRYFTMIPMLAVAGTMARKRIHPGGSAVFPTHGVLFVGLLVGVIVIVGALTFFPALTLGSLTEHFSMQGLDPFK